MNKRNLLLFRQGDKVAVRNEEVTVLTEPYARKVSKLLWNSTHELRSVYQFLTFINQKGDCLFVFFPPKCENFPFALHPKIFQPHFTWDLLGSDPSFFPA